MIHLLVRVRNAETSRQGLSWRAGAATMALQTVTGECGTQPDGLQIADAEPVSVCAFSRHETACRLPPSALHRLTRSHRAWTRTIRRRATNWNRPHWNSTGPGESTQLAFTPRIIHWDWRAGCRAAGLLGFDPVAVDCCMSANLPTDQPETAVPQRKIRHPVSRTYGRMPRALTTNLWTKHTRLDTSPHGNNGLPRERMSKKETPMTRQYWKTVGGTLIEEFLAVKAGPENGTRKLDGVIILGGPSEIQRTDAVELAGRDIIVVQTKAARLGMNLLGQAVFSRRLMEAFQPSSIRSVALCTKGDSVLKPFAEEYGIEVVVMPDFHSTAPQVDAARSD